MVIYLGFLIGAFNLLILFPRFIPVEYMGLTKVIQDYSVLITSFASLGFIAPFFRFSPYFQKYTLTGRNDLLQLYLIVVHVGMLVLVILSIALKGVVTGYFNTRSPLFSTYYYSTLVFGYLLLIYNVLEMYLFSKGEAIFQSMVREIIIRVIIGIMVVAVILGLPLNYFIGLFTIHYIVPIGLLTWFIIKNHPTRIGISISKTTRRLIPFMFSMAGVGMLQNVVNAGLPVIDTLVVGSLVGLEGVANYLISTYIATLVYVPVRATGGVLGARIAAFWKDNNLARIQELYHRTSMSYLIFCFFVVSVILFNINLFQKVLGNNISLNLGVIVLLVAGKVFDLSTGLSNVILGYSKKWRWESAIGIFALIIALPMNIFFVGKWGILGAAFSGLVLAVAVFSVRLIILYKVYGLFPFNLNSLTFIFLGLGLSGVFYWFCQQTELILMKILVSLVYMLVYVGLVLKFKFSEDVNLIFITIQNRFLNWRNQQRSK